MAIQKGAKVEKTVTTVIILKIQGPSGMLEFDPVEADDESAIDSLIETASQYERGGVTYEIVRRETQVRTQVSDTPLTINELREEGEEESSDG